MTTASTPHQTPTFGGPIFKFFFCWKGIQKLVGWYVDFFDFFDFEGCRAKKEFLVFFCGSAVKIVRFLRVICLWKGIEL